MLAYLTSAIRWAVGLTYSFTVMIFLTLLSFVVPLRKVHGLIRVLFRSMLWVFGLRVKVRGLENLDPTHGYVFMSNHVNLFEPFITATVVPQWIVALEKQENFKVPIYGQLIKRWGNIAIDRNNFQSAMKSLERCKEALAEGVAIQVMPEGTRSRNGQLGPFKKGGFHMAMDAGASIAPYVFRGLYEYSRTGSWLIRPTTIEVVFTPTIDTQDYTKETLGDLMERVRGQIEGALEAEAQSSPALEPEPSPSH